VDRADNRVRGLPLTDLLPTPYTSTKGRLRRRVFSHRRFPIARDGELDATLVHWIRDIGGALDATSVPFWAIAHPRLSLRISAGTVPATTRARLSKRPSVQTDILLVLRVWAHLIYGPVPTCEVRQPRVKEKKKSETEGEGE